LHEVLRIHKDLGTKTLRGCDPSEMDVAIVDMLSNPIVLAYLDSRR
jgi:hypothetical protein